MKKIISLIAAGALALGLIGCSGDLHDAELIDLAGYGLRGSLTGWNAADDVPLVKQDDGTYTYTFTSTDDDAYFAVLQMGDGSWSTAYRLSQPKASGDAANVFSTEGNAQQKGMKQKVYLGQSADCMKIPSVKGKSVTITVTPSYTYLEVEVKVAEGSGASTPTPYYFDGLYLVGGCFNVDGSSTNTWNFSPANLIYGAETKVATGNVVYTKDITATATSGEMGINDSTWNNKLNGVGVTIAADAEEATALDGTAGNFNVTGLTVGEPYRVVITTTPEKDVSVKIFKIASVTFKFQITNLDEGDVAWVNGTIWGSGWPMGWPIKAWNGYGPDNTAEQNTEAETKTAGYISAHDPATANAAGTAVFAATWNTTFIAQIGDSLSYQCKVVYHAAGDDWDGENTVLDSGADNLSFDFDVTAGGTYVVTIDASTWEITAAAE